MSKTAKILIISTNQEKFDTVVMPIGAAYAATSLKESGHDVRFLDLCFVKNIPVAVSRAFTGFVPDAIGLSIRNIDSISFVYPAWQMDKVKDIVALCRKYSKAPVILGGTAVSILPEEILRYTHAEYAVIGDAELTLCAIAEKICRHQPFDDTPGLSRLKNGTYHASPPNRCKQFSWSRLPHWIDIRPYCRSRAGIPLQTKRGCTNQCIYCVYAGIEGRSMRLRQPGDIVDEIEWLIQKTGWRYFDFVDSTFNLPLTHAQDICREIIARKVNARFTTMGINPKETTPEFFELMKKAGFTSLEVTVESASNAMLATMKKGFTKDDAIRTAALSNKAGLHVAWFFLFGAPGETQDTIKESLDFARTYLASKNNLVMFTLGIRLFASTELARIVAPDARIDAHYSMLSPLFYLDPGLDALAAFDQIKNTVEKHDNFIMSLEENASRLSMEIYSRFLSLLRLPPPHWRYFRCILGAPVVKQIRRASFTKIRSAITTLEPDLLGIFTAATKKNIPRP